MAEAAQKKKGDALALKFAEAFRAANKQSPPPGATQKLKELMAACAQAGVKPWQKMSDPLTAALGLVLTVDMGRLGVGALPVLWCEQAHDLRVSLGAADAPPLERMLIDHTVVCWLRLAVMEFRYSAVVSANNTFTAVEHTERRLTEAQKRFNRACEALAKVSKLSRPKVQINVAAAGGQQVNVA